MSHHLAQLGELVWIRGDRHCAGRAETPLAHIHRRKPGDVYRNVAIDGLMRCEKVLKLFAARIRSLHEHKHAAAPGSRSLDKGLQTVVAHVRVNGHCIGTQGLDAP